MRGKGSFKFKSIGRKKKFDDFQESNSDVYKLSFSST